MQVNQWKSEALRLEQESGTLTKEIHDLQAVISKSRVKQEALEAQSTLRTLQTEKVKAGEHLLRKHCAEHQLLSFRDSQRCLLEKAALAARTNSFHNLVAVYMTIIL